MGLRLTHGHIPSFRKTDAALPKSPVTLPYELRREMTWHDFTNNANPLGAPREIVHAMQHSLVSDELDFVPDPSGHQFRHRLSDALGVPEKCILIGNSTIQLLRLVAEAFPHGDVVIPMPCPASYFNSVEHAGHTAIPYQMGATYATPHVSTTHNSIGDFNGIVIGNPSFPASRFSPTKTVMHYADSCDWVVVDESFLDLSYNGQSMIPLIKKYKNVIVLRNLSITYGMPGVPLAYLIASEQIVAHVRQYFDGSPNTMFSEVVSQFVGEDQRYLEHTHDLMESEIPWLHSMLSKIPQMKTFTPDGNFILCQFKPNKNLRLGAMSSQELLQKMQMKGFLLLDLTGWPGFKGSGYFCVAVRSRDENQELVQTMDRTVFVDMHFDRP